MASSSRKKRARKGGDDKGHGENERNEGRRNEKRRAKTGHDEKALAKQRRNEAARKRYAEDADYREKLLAYSRAYKREHRGPRPPLTPEERARQTAREKERYATDPDFRAARLASQRKRGRKKELKHRYGLSWEDYQAMLARQDGKCAICKCEFTDTPSVDHCHLTRKVRRLLCRDCNTGLGRFKDDPHRVLAALQYLLEFLGDEAPFTVTVIPKSRPSSAADPVPERSERATLLSTAGAVLRCLGRRMRDIFKRLRDASAAASHAAELKLQYGSQKAIPSPIAPAPIAASSKERPLPPSPRCDNVAVAENERLGEMLRSGAAATASPSAPPKRTTGRSRPCTARSAAPVWPDWDWSRCLRPGPLPPPKPCN